MRGNLLRTTSLETLVLWLVASCSASEPGAMHSSDNGTTASSTGTDASGSDADGSTLGPGDGLLPPECQDGANPFVEEKCGGALRRICRAQASEQDCTGQDPFVFDEYGFGCAWVNVVKIVETDTCAIESSTWRCEAGITSGAGCGVGPCGEGPGLYDAWNAIPSEIELIDMGCIRGFAIDGPIGEWTELGNQAEQGDNLYVHSCSADLPPPPELCTCQSAACEAR